MPLSFHVLLFSTTFVFYFSLIFTLYFSGLLVCYFSLNELKSKDGRMNWGLFYFHRFWRYVLTVESFQIMRLVKIGSERFMHSINKCFIRPNWIFIKQYKNIFPTCFFKHRGFFCQHKNTVKINEQISSFKIK